MTDVDTQDWLRPGETAYILVDTNVTGVGNYLTAHRVQIVTVGVRDVKVKPYGTADTGNLTRFRRNNLTAPGSGGKYAHDDILVAPGDPRIRTAQDRARAVVAVSDVTSVIHAVERRLDSRIVEWNEDVLSDRLHDLARLRDAATKAHTSLLRLREALS